MPKVSVIIPVYNHSSYIMEAIGSVRSQTFHDVEIFVVDDGSTDQIQKEIEPAVQAITYIYKSNGGTASALNKGIRSASGDWVCWLSADDLFMPTKLSRQLQAVESNKQAGLVYTSFYVINAYGAIVRKWDSPSFPNKAEWANQLLQHCYINGSSVMVRKDLLYEVGLFDESLPYAHDYDLWLRLLPYCEFVHCPEQLLKYRQHANSSTARLNMEVHRAELATIKQRAAQLFRQKGLMA